jgi:hypothetical protein
MGTIVLGVVILLVAVVVRSAGAGLKSAVARPPAPWFSWSALACWLSVCSFWSARPSR